MIQKIYNAFIECDQKITTDTRKITNGCVFFALKGPNFNGNKFAAEAITKGAKYVVIDEPAYSIDNATILVDNVLESLQQLAHHHRNEFNIPVVGITGTNGKTTTKELIGTVLESKYKTLITEGNLNNHIGVPLTLLKLNNSHEIAVIEMGASKKGDIKELVEIAQPTHGIITNIGKAHLEGFGNLETIKETKLELFQYIIKNQGEIIVNNDDELLFNEIPGNIKTHTYGKIKGQIIGGIENYHPTIEVSLKIQSEKSIKCTTSLLGGYNLLNILAAATIGNLFNINEEEIVKSISNYIPSNNRSQLIKTKHNIVIADCYNANPTSTMESIISLNSMNASNKIAILGDMLELGEESVSEHQNIIDYLIKNKIDCLLVGECYKETACEFNKFNNVDRLISFLKENQLNDHLILLKGSRGIQLEKVINQNIF